MKKNLINHVALVIDDSPSMGHLVSKTREVVDAQIRGFQATSKLKNQETRVSVYVFGGHLRCVAFDRSPKDVPRAGEYVNATISATAMVDASMEVIRQLNDIPTHRGDHSFLVYVITDGEDNASRHSGFDLERVISRLDDEWTVAALVPNIKGKHHAKSFGFPVDNIEIWDATSEQGMEEVGNTICDSYMSYSTARSLGTKSTKTLFKFNDVTKKDVVRKLEVVPAGEYQTLLVRDRNDGDAIKDFVEDWTGEPYRVGSAYYQLTKPEKIQAGKALAVVERATGKMYSGVHARNLLGLPNYEVKVAPADYDRFDVFVQSTSTNRKLVAQTQVIVFK